MAKLAVLDYIVIVVSMLAVVSVGLVCSRRKKSLKEYFLASGEVKWWAVSISLYATALSPLSFLGVVAWVYSKDSRWYVGGTLLSIFINLLSAIIWIPLWHRLQLMSIYEYLEKRFHPLVRTFGAPLFLLGTVFWIGNALVTASMAFETVTGYDAVYCMLAITVLGTIYVMLGGARAVIWADVAQAAIFIGAFIVMGILLLKNFNWSPKEIYTIASSEISPITNKPHTQMFSTEFSLAIEGTIWAIIFCRIWDIFMFGTSQVYVQRLMASGSKKNMFKTLMGQTGMELIFTFLSVTVGWGLVAYYITNPEKRAGLGHVDKVLVYYVGDNFIVMVRGVVIAGLLAAMMSTFDSALNSMCSVTINDFYRRYFVKDKDEHHYLFASRFATMGLAVLLMLFAWWQSKHAEETALQRVAELNVLLQAPIWTFFILGVFSKRVNTAGALIGGLVGMALAVSLNGFPGLFKPLLPLNINWMWISGFSTLAGLAAGYAASLFFKAPDHEKLKGLSVLERD